MDGPKANESELETFPKYVEIPRGWSRILENGSILYISPSSHRLRCRDQVIDYLTTGGTCKCGLECPLHIDKVFIFDAKVPSKLTDQNADSKRKSNCHHCEGNSSQKELPQLFTPTSSASQAVMTKNESDDSKFPTYGSVPRGGSGPKKASVRSRKSALDVNKQSKVSIPISIQEKEVNPSAESIYSSITNPLGSVTKASPVQNVPTNLATSNQGPLPSFASIVSSFKIFNPGRETDTTVVNTAGTQARSLDRKVTTTMSSTTLSIPSSVQRTITNTVNSVASSQSNVQMKTIQQNTSKPLAEPRNTTTLKSCVTTMQVTSSVCATPHTNVSTVAASLSTKNVLVSLSSKVGNISSAGNVVRSTPVSLASISKMSATLYSGTTPVYTTVVPSPRSAALTTAVVPQTPVLLTTRSPSTTSVSSVSFTLSTATVATGSSRISATVSTVASLGNITASVVNPMQSLANTEIARSSLLVSSATNQSGNLGMVQQVSAKTTVKSMGKPFSRSRVTKLKPALPSKKQGIKPPVNTTDFLSGNTSGDKGTSASPLQVSSVQNHPFMKTTLPSSVTAPVMTPTLWNPAMMAKCGQSSQGHTHSYLSGAWSSVLSPNIAGNNLMGLRHPPPSATAPTIVTTMTTVLQNKVEDQGTATSGKADAMPSKSTTSLAIPQSSITSSRPQQSVPILSSTNQKAFSFSQTQGGSQGAQLKSTAPNVFSPSQVVAAVTQGAVSAVPQVQPAIVAPVPSNLFYQSAGINQMYNPQGLDMNQVKALGQYQVQWPALYPSQLATNTMLLATNQEKGATTPAANIAQQGYPNPFMFGIIMPTPQQGGLATPTASVTGSSVNPTVAPSVASTAVAAAYGSYVPIAPAATPRFSQTLAHLANAYNPYGSTVRGTAPPSNQLQFTYRMMQMSALASGNNIPLSSACATNLDHSLKYPLSSVKQVSYGATSSASTANSSAIKTTVSAALQNPAQTVVAAMSYVPLSTQAGSAQPLSTVPLAATASTGDQSRTSATSAVVPVQPFTYGMMTPAANIDPKTGNTTFGYLLIPPTGEAISSCASDATGETSAVLQSSVPTPVSTVPNRDAPTQGVSKTPIVNPSTSSLCPASSSGLRLWTPWSTTSTGVALGTSESNPVVSHTLLYTQPSISAPPRTTIFSSVSTVQVPPSHTTSIQQPYSTSNVHHVKSDLQSRMSPPHPPTREKCGSPLAESKGLKRTYFEDARKDKMNSNNEKRAKYDFQPSKFVETDPLLGMKRSCEAIEVYPIHKETKKNRKCSDNKNCGEGDSDDDEGEEEEEDGGVDESPMVLTENHDKTNSIPVEPKTESKSSSPEVEKPPVSTGDTNEHLSGAETPNGDLDESQHTDISELPDIRSDGLMAKLRDSAELVECLPSLQVRPNFGIGDIVWAQARGLPSWPGKIVDERIVGKGRPDDGKRWVMWFGDHTFSQVEVDRLKTLTEGLKSLDDKGKKKKYRAKKARISLEQAISEALEELDKKELLKTKQSGKGKPKKKRMR